MMSKVGLVLEGGGVRGTYTSGVLDFMLDHDLKLPYVIGVSMGACNGASYISGQKGRSLDIALKYVRDKRYISYRRWLRTGNLFGMDFIFGDIPERLIPFDFDGYFESGIEFVAGTTNCLDGKPLYHAMDRRSSFNQLIQASCSIPGINDHVTFNNTPLVDGGVSDSVPVEKALADGCDKIIVVLTRVDGYVKKPYKFTGLLKAKYRKFPMVIKAIEQRHIGYNKKMATIKKLEEEGRALVIRPTKEVKVSQADRRLDRIQAIYDLGYNDTAELYQKICSFIEE